MNNITMTATIVGTPQTSTTHERALRARFTVETSGGELPLRFIILSYGNQAKAASALQDGDEVLVTGRMVASAATKSIAVICNGLELLFEGEQTNGTSAEQNVSTKT